MRPTLRLVVIRRFKTRHRRLYRGVLQSNSRHRRRMRHLVKLRHTRRDIVLLREVARRSRRQGQVRGVTARNIVRLAVEKCAGLHANVRELGIELQLKLRRRPRNALSVVVLHYLSSYLFYE